MPRDFTGSVCEGSACIGWEVQYHCFMLRRLKKVLPAPCGRVEGLGAGFAIHYPAMARKTFPMLIQDDDRSDKL